MASTADILHARRKLCFKVAEWLDPGDEPYDIDEAADKAYQIIPHTYAEADLELADVRSECKLQRGPSMIAALREAVHVTPDMSIRTIMDAATRKCNSFDAMKAALEEALDTLEAYDCGNVEIHERIRAALALAKGEA